jgi:hypothetical protein
MRVCYIHESLRYQPARMSTCAACAVKQRNPTAQSNWSEAHNFGQLDNLFVGHQLTLQS